MATDKPFRTYDTAFHEWRNAAIDSGLLSHALSQFYASDLDTHGYAYSIDGHEEHVPVATTPEWLTPGVTDLRVTQSATPLPVREDDAALREYVRPIAFNNGDDASAVSVDEYLWNGTIFGTNTLSLGASTLDVRPMSFYTAVTNFTTFRESLYRSLHDARVSPSASRPFPDAALSGTPRDAIAPTLPTLLESDFPLSTGGGAVVIANTGDGYCLLLSQRSSESAEMPGWLEVAPAGFFEPDDCDESEYFTRHVLREFSEEIFGHPESDDPLAASEVTEVASLLETNGATLTPVIAYVNPEKFHVSVFGACIIDDPEFYQSYLADDGLGGWESAGVEFTSLSEEEPVRTLLNEPSVKWHHLPAVVEALLYFEETRDEESLPVSVTRTNPT